MGHLVQPSCRGRVTYSRLHRTLSRQKRSWHTPKNACHLVITLPTRQRKAGERCISKLKGQGFSSGVSCPAASWGLTPAYPHLWLTPAVPSAQTEPESLRSPLKAIGVSSRSLSLEKQVVLYLTGCEGKNKHLSRVSDNCISSSKCFSL